MYFLYNLISAQMWCLASLVNCCVGLIQQNNLFCRLTGSHPLGADEAGRAFGKVVGRMEQLRVIE